MVASPFFLVQPAQCHTQANYPQHAPGPRRLRIATLADFEVLEFRSKRTLRKCWSLDDGLIILY